MKSLSKYVDWIGAFIVIGLITVVAFIVIK